MKNQNFILNGDFLDFQIFATPGTDSILPHCVGSNERKLLVAISVLDKEKLLDFLKKILAAVKYDLEKDALLLNLTPKIAFGFKDLDRVYGFDKAIFFGFQPQEVGLNFNMTPYQLLHFNQQTFLFAHDLSQIEQEQPLKKTLWKALKEMF